MGEGKISDHVAGAGRGCFRGCLLVGGALCLASFLGISLCDGAQFCSFSGRPARASFEPLTNAFRCDVLVARCAREMIMSKNFNYLKFLI